MTVVHCKFFQPSASGEDVPSTGVLHLAPTRRRVKTGDPDTVILPAAFPATVSGTLDLDLAPSGPDWCWELKASFEGVGFWTEYLAVPEPIPDSENPGEYLPVDYPDLVRVDPKTLDPVPEALAGWTAVLSEIQALRTETVQAAIMTNAMSETATEAASQALVSSASAGTEATRATEAADRANDTAEAIHLTISHDPTFGFIFTQGGPVA